MSWEVSFKVDLAIEVREKWCYSDWKAVTSGFQHGVSAGPLDKLGLFTLEALRLHGRSI